MPRDKWYVALVLGHNHPGLTTILSDSHQPAQKVSFSDGICGYPQISHVPRRVFVFGEVGCGDFAVKSRLYVLLTTTSFLPLLSLSCFL